MSWLRAFKLFVVFGFPLLGFVYFYQFTGQTRTRAVPFFSFPRPEQTTWEDSAGKKIAFSPQAPVTVVNYWATWCPPCVEEFPAMMELERSLRGKGVEFIFVSVDQAWPEVHRFLEENRIQLDPGQLYRDPDQKMARLWGSVRFPETYVVRGDGWIVEKIVGAQLWTRPEVVEYFEKLGEKFKLLTPLANMTR